MADVRIPELPVRVSVDDSDLMVGDNGSDETYAVTVSNFKKSIVSSDFTKPGLAAESQAVGNALAQKQDVLQYDSVPTQNSNNSLSSGTIYTAINNEKTAREEKDDLLLNLLAPVNKSNVAESDYERGIPIIYDNKICMTRHSIKEGDTLSFDTNLQDYHYYMNFDYVDIVCQIANWEDTISAHDYVVGDYFVYFRHLCEAIAPIYTGDTLLYGKNFRYSLIGDKLTYLKKKTDDTLPTETVSGTTVSFTDSAENVPVKDMVLNIEPKQYMNGYSHPWIGGAGKNLLKNTATTSTINGITFTVNSDGSIKANGTATATTIFHVNYALLLPAGKYIISGCPDGGGNNTFKFDINISSSTYAADYGSGKTFTLTDSTTHLVRIVVYSGQTLSNQMFYPMIRLSTVADATYEPYENICPIYGYTSVEITRRNENLFNINKFVNRDSNGVNFYKNTIHGFIGLHGTSTATAYFGLPMINVTTIPITVIIKTSGFNGTLTFTGMKDNSQVYGAEITLTEGTTEYIKIINATSLDELYIYGTVNSGQTFSGSDHIGICVLEGTHTVDDYLPSVASNYSVSFSSAGTVYGGTLDVTTGELVVKYTKHTFTENETSIVWYSVANGARYYNTDIADGVYLADSCVVCNIMPNDNSSDGLCFYQSGTSDNHNLYFKNLALLDSSIVDVDTFKTWLSNNVLEVTYKLATPITYQLTPTEVTTLLGYNNISMDANGTLDVTYRADLVMYIDSKTKAVKALIAPVEESYKATRNYTVGSYVIVEDTLYKVTSAIASGGTITPGSNATATTVMDQIMALT